MTPFELLLLGVQLLLVMYVGAAMALHQDRVFQARWDKIWKKYDNNYRH